MAYWQPSDRPGQGLIKINRLLDSPDIPARTTPETGPQERLSQTGDNLPNVIQYLKEQHEPRLDDIQ